jgi:vacuolar protein sorting-associated protein 1
MEEVEVWAKNTQILMHHIRATLPDIKQRITTQLQKYSAELQSLGGVMGDQSSSSMVLAVITEFTSEFRNAIDGNTDDLSLNELSGGARISFVFHELFNNGIKSIDPFDQVKDGDIRTILYNSSVISLWIQRSSLWGDLLITSNFRGPRRHCSSARRRLRSS